jgi:hypothetical protein
VKALPDVVLVQRAAWTSERNHVRERFEVWGGDIAEEWTKSLRVPSAPWCTVTIWDEGTQIVSYGGVVWPAAWPEVFSISGPVGHQHTTLTATGVRLFDQAREYAATRIRP